MQDGQKGVRAKRRHLQSAGRKGQGNGPGTVSTNRDLRAGCLQGSSRASPSEVRTDQLPDGEKCELKAVIPTDRTREPLGTQGS